ncbi:MAG TPA: response regulator [Azospirillum sp.]|nr:response regulator [Azospirillum sp.]
MRLLVVDDDPLIGSAMRAVLEQAGHAVLGPVRYAAKALRIAERDRPDLALVDLALPGGENGLSLARRLDELAVPCLLVTGYDVMPEEAGSATIGVLRKPFAPDVLLASIGTIDEALAGFTTAPPPQQLRLFGARLARFAALWHAPI